MSNAKLTIGGEGEVTIETPVTTIGRASDNTIPLPYDSNVSRYHCEIESRGSDFYLTDLGSSNGTTVNGNRVRDETLLEDGDTIVLGGTSEIIFNVAPETREKGPGVPESAFSAHPELPSLDTSLPAAPAEIQAPSKVPVVLGIAAAVCGLAVVCVVAAVVFSLSGGSRKCEAKAVITKPENGDTISKETPIEIEMQNADCVRRAIFVLDDAEVASADSDPYTAALDPDQFPDLADGTNHSLKVVLEDDKGVKTAQAGEVLLSFDTAEVATPTPTPVIAATPGTSQPPVTGKQASVIDVQDMCKKLVKEFSGSFNYKFDPLFLQDVQKKTGEYAADGYFAKAQVYQDMINVSFHKENNLDAPLPYILAMSRSKFNLQKQDKNEGLWQMSDEFVTANGYKASCPGESLSDASQTCAGKTAALYLKGLVLKIFEGDTVYAAASFGMTEGEADAFKQTLPADRSNFWQVLKSPKQRELVSRFFAAGIVAENPQKFGLKKDKAISELYKNLVGN
jgi:FHA domain/Bacterial Ig domain